MCICAYNIDLIKFQEKASKLFFFLLFNLFNSYFIKYLYGKTKYNINKFKLDVFILMGLVQ